MALILFFRFWSQWRAGPEKTDSWEIKRNLALLLMKLMRNMALNVGQMS
jgi:hypothetical protein